MSTRSMTRAGWAAGVAVLLGAVLIVQAAAALAAGPDAASQVVAQGVPTPTPFTFRTPTPITVRPATTTGSTTTTTTTRAPSTGGFPLELALPALTGGLAAIGGGSYLLRRKTVR